MAGLIVGNPMTSTVLAGRRLQEEFADKRDEIEARLALGLVRRLFTADHRLLALARTGG